MAANLSTRPLVLASTSPHRRELMQRLGLPFRAVDPHLDEASYKARGHCPEELVLELAQAKAHAVRAAHADAWIIGSDQCAEVDGKLLGKPGTFESAVEQIRLLSGRAHRLLTGLCLLDAATGSAQLHVDVHTLHMRPMTLAQIERYVTRERPLDCAGGYRIESLGVALFESMQGSDYTAVIGLPMMRLTSMLQTARVEVF
jgi:septum formation protein